MCLAFGIQPIVPNTGQSKTLSYNEWEHKKKGTSWKQQIRLNIDKLINSAKNLDELLVKLKHLGYTVKRGKYISIKADGQQRFIRCKSHGEEDSLTSRIKWHDVGSIISLNDNEPITIKSAYNHAIHNASKLANDNKKIPRKHDDSLPYSAKNDSDIYKLSAQLSIINRDNINSIGELEGKIERLKYDYEKTCQELNTLTLKQEYINNLSDQVEIFIELSNKVELSTTEQLKQNICKQTLQSCNINDYSDMERLKSLQNETNKKLAVLKDNFKNCHNQYTVYSDIAKTYYEISKGDYISKLVEKERNKREQAKQGNKKHSI